MFDPAHLVFIDETAANTKMVRLNGRCARGERLVARVPHGHWQTVTFVAALRHNAMTAPCVVNGAMNGETFLAYVEQCLAPTLKRNDTVMMDHLKAHKVAGVREAIAARHCDTCRNTRPTSIQSKCPSASSRPSCANSPSAPSPDYAERLASSLEVSARAKPPTTSDMQAMRKNDRNLL
jgi:transposase-like protein